MIITKSDIIDIFSLSKPEQTLMSKNKNELKNI